MGMNDQIRRFIVKELMHEEDPSLIGDDASLLDRGILDSLGLLHVISFLEREYNFTVDDQDLLPEHFESVSSIAAFVEKRRNCSAVN